MRVMRVPPMDYFFTPKAVLRSSRALAAWPRDGFSPLFLQLSAEGLWTSVQWPLTCRGVCPLSTLDGWYMPLFGLLHSTIYLCVADIHIYSLIHLMFTAHSTEFKGHKGASPVYKHNFMWLCWLSFMWPCRSTLGPSLLTSKDDMLSAPFALWLSIGFIPCEALAGDIGRWRIYPGKRFPSCWLQGWDPQHAATCPENLSPLSIINHPGSQFAIS